MSAPTPAEEVVARARDLFEQGASLRDVGREVGKSGETIRRWALAGGWTAPTVMAGADRRPKPVPTSEELEAARLRAEKARQENRTRWAVRRSEEADRVGLAAGRVRQVVMEMVEAGKTAEARQLATVYGIFVDKALVMAQGDIPRGRQGDETGPSVHGEARPTDPAEIAEAGARRALTLLRPTIDAVSRARDASA